MFEIRWTSLNVIKSRCFFFIIGIDVLQIVFWFFNQNSNTASHSDTFGMYLIDQKQLLDSISEANNMMIDWRKKKTKAEKMVSKISRVVWDFIVCSIVPFQQNVCTKWNFCMFRRSSMIFYRWLQLDILKLCANANAAHVCVCVSHLFIHGLVAILRSILSLISVFRCVSKYKITWLFDPERKPAKNLLNRLWK